MITTETLYWLLFAIPSILIASTVHEYSHGLAAFKLGDLQQKHMEDLHLILLNIDPIGALP